MTRAMARPSLSYSSLMRTFPKLYNSRLAWTTVVHAARAKITHVAPNAEVKTA